MITASLTSSPRYFSASAFSFCSTTAEISSGVTSRPLSGILISTSAARPSAMSKVTAADSFRTSATRRPTNRLAELMVFLGFITAWRRASCPTRRWPPLAYATTDGVRRLPSALVTTVGSPPSMTATTEFVVPRSIPMILLAICCLLGRSGRGRRSLLIQRRGIVHQYGR